MFLYFGGVFQTVYYTYGAYVKFKCLICSGLSLYLKALFSFFFCMFYVKISFECVHFAYFNYIDFLICIIAVIICIFRVFMCL